MEKFHAIVLTLLIISSELESTLALKNRQDFSEGFSYDRIPTRRPVEAEVPKRPQRPPSVSPSGSGSRYLRRKKPGRKNMDKSYLLSLMGEDFKEGWMSDEAPDHHTTTVPSNAVFEDYSVRWAQDRLLDDMQSLNLTAELGALQPDLLALESSVKSWLLKRSTCPVQFSWQELGTNFWPRWVRTGECADKMGACSWPPGMHCVPAATTTLHLLRWQCRNKRNKALRSGLVGQKGGVHVLYRGRVPDIGERKKKGKRCDWFRVPLPITIDCFCTC